MDNHKFQGWLDRYVDAWNTYDEQSIRNLFSEDAEYRYHPQDEPVRGRDEIVKSWLDDRDESGTYDAKYEATAIDGDVHVATGWSRYFDADGAVRDEFCNVFICRFDRDGRCREFTEYWIQNREFARRARAEAVRQAAGSSA